MSDRINTSRTPTMMVRININKEEVVPLIITCNIRMIGGGIRTSSGTITCRGRTIGSTIIIITTTIASLMDHNRLPEEDVVEARAAEEADEGIVSTITIISRIGMRTNGTTVEEEEEVEVVCNSTSRTTTISTHNNSITTPTNNSIMIVVAHLITIKRRTTTRT